LAQLAEIIERLQSTLGAAEGEPRPLEGGITNHNFVARLGGVDYVIRLPGKETQLLGVDREAERAAGEAAARVGVAPEVAALLANPPALVTRFVDGKTMSAEELREPEMLAAVATALRTLHGSGAEIAASFSGYRVGESFAARTRERGGEVPAAYETARATALRIEQAIEAPERVGAAIPGGIDRRPVLCHDDLLAANFIHSEHGLRVVDWEYAGMGDRYFDLGNFAVNNELSEAQEEAFLAAYLEREPAPRELAALRLMRFMSDFREAMWGVIQGSLSDLDFDFADYARKHFDRLAAAEAASGFGALLEDARGA
jgi:thiamine kinase-like enzyme